MLYAIAAVLRKAWMQLGALASSLLPNIIAALVILMLGSALGWMAGLVANRLLRAAQIDRRINLLGLSPSLETLGIASGVRLLARVFQWFVVLLAAILALYSLNARVAADLATRLLLYIPALVMAVLILLLGFVLSRFLARGVLIAAVNARIASARLLSALTRAAVMVVAVAASLEHLALARATVFAAFVILFGGAVFCAALALALGSQPLVQRWLEEHFRPGRSADRGTFAHHN